MTSSQRTILLMAALWLALGLSQSVRTAHVCFDGTSEGVVTWMLQFALLGAPLVALKRDTAHRPSDSDVRGPLTLILLTYVPTTLALRIAEMCARR
jgi:hypothetical protein